MYLKVHRDDKPVTMMNELRNVIGLPLHLSTHHIALRKLFSTSSDALKSDMEAEDVDDDFDGEDEILYSETYVRIFRFRIDFHIFINDRL